MTSPGEQDKIKLMTYNVWSRGHVAVYRRIRAICELIERHSPDVMILQEVTEYIHSLLEEAPWWTKYMTSVSHRDSSGMQRSNHSCLLLSKLAAHEEIYSGPSPPLYKTYSPRSPYTPGSPSWPPSYEAPPSKCVVVPTNQPRRRQKRPRSELSEVPPDLLSAWVHLPICAEASPLDRQRAATCCPTGPTPMGVDSMHRRDRAGLFLEHFNHHGHRNVVLGGDLGWDDDLDGQLPLGGGGRWVDAWSELRGGEGWTYDAVANPMLRGCRPERMRPDRFLCYLHDFRLNSIEMIGVEPIPSVAYLDDKADYALPVLPSHHSGEKNSGLLLTIASSAQPPSDWD